MTIRISDYPQLKFISWFRKADDFIEENEALTIYERNWQYIDVSQLAREEQAFIDYLVAKYGNGVLLV